MAPVLTTPYPAGVTHSGLWLYTGPHRHPFFLTLNLGQDPVESSGNTKMCLSNILRKLACKTIAFAIKVSCIYGKMSSTVVCRCVIFHTKGGGLPQSENSTSSDATKLQISKHNRLKNQFGFANCWLPALLKQYCAAIILCVLPLH